MELPKEIEQLLPLSPVQSGMLIHSISNNAEAGTYVGIVSFVIEGTLAADRFQRALNAAVNARDVLRASFLYEDIKTPVQVIHHQVDIPWIESDWTSLDSDRVAQDKNDLFDRERMQGFDLAAAPLMRAHLIKLSDVRHLFVWSLHHILSDGWSTSLVLDDVLRRYEHDAAEEGAETKPGIGFRDYLVWLKRQNSAAAQEYWTDHMAGFEGPTRIEAVGPNQLSSNLHKIVRSQVSVSMTDTVDKTARDLRVTQSSFLAALWALILRRYSGGEDVTFGFTTAGRPVDLSGVAGAVGPFVNTLPLRIAIAGDMTFEALATRLETTVRERARHECAALSDVRDWSGAQAGQQIFDALFVHESIPALSVPGGDLRIFGMEILGPSNYGISLVATPVDGLRVEIYHDPNLYPDALVKDILADFERALEHAANMPSDEIGTFFVDAAQLGDGEIPRGHDFPSVIAALADVADRTPNATAVTDNGKSFTYKSLFERVEQIAHVLHKAGVAAGDIVPVAVERSAEAVAAYFGVLAVGAAYVPIDLEYPSRSLRHIFELADAKLVLTTSSAKVGLPTGSWKTLCLDLAEKSTARRKFVAPAADATAYILFTSGSQGVPKGVTVSHGALSHSTFVRNDVFGGAPDSFLLLSSFAFDSSVVGLFWTICAGGHLVVAPRQVERDPAEIGALIEKHSISHALCLPSLYEALLGAIEPARLQKLNTVIVAGEAVQNEQIACHRSALPHCRLFNEYGPTEATVWATIYDTAECDLSGPVPIGKAIPGVDVVVRDLDGSPLPQNIKGEITISGPTLADGYLNDAEKTSASFPVIRTKDMRGLRIYRTGDLGVSTKEGLLFAGRLDQQVKIRGHRVEIGEIEAVARVTLGAASCAAVLLQRKSGYRLVFCIKGARNIDVEDQLKTAFEAHLPEHAQPTGIVWLSALKQLPNGKLDLKSIAIDADAELETEITEGDPLVGIEKKLAQIWQDVLGLQCVSRDANFFDIGGDSLKTIALYSLAERQGFNLSPNDVFEHPTLKGLAAHIMASAQKEYEHIDARDVRKVHVEGADTPVVLLHANMLIFNQLARGLGKDRPLGLKFSSHYEGENLSLRTTVEAMAVETLSGFDGFFDHENCVLVGYSAGAAVAVQMAQVLEERGCKVRLLCLVDPPLNLRRPVENSKAVNRRLRKALRIGLEFGRFAAGYLYYSVSQAREPRRLLKISRATAIAMTRFEPKRYDGKVLLLSTNPNEDYSSCFPAAEVEYLQFEHFELTSNRSAEYLVAARLLAHINTEQSTAS